MSKDIELNLVENEASVDTKNVSIDSLNEPGQAVPQDVAKDAEEENEGGKNPWASIAKEIKSGKLTTGNRGENRVYDKVIDADLDDYRDYLGTDIFKPDDAGLDLLNTQRANNQGVFEQAGRFLGQAVMGEIVGGSIEGLGYLLDIGSVLDVMQGDEAEWGNFMTDFGQSIREGTEEKLRIYQDPNATGFSKMADSGWWFSNGVSVASTLSMLIPTTGAMKALSFVGRGIGASKGMQAARKAAGLAEKMGTKGKWMTEGISQAVLSRNIENWMESHGTYKSYKAEKLREIDKETGKLFTEDKANDLASKAASSNWKLGWAMLLQDIPQYLALGKVFNPISKKMENAVGVGSKNGLNSGMKPWQEKASAAAQTFIGEGGEESYQFIIAERAKFKTDLDSGYITEEQYDKKMSEAFGSEEMLTSAFFGGLGGNLFQFAGKGVNSAFKSKNQKEYEETLGKYYEKTIKQDAQQVALMFQHLNSADQEESPVARKAVINEMMLNLTAKSLEANKFDQFYETLSQISNMSEEDRVSFEEGAGSEFDLKLAEEYIPQILTRSLEMRDKYLKHRNNYSAETSSKLSRLELENESMGNLALEKREATEAIRNGLGNAWKYQASSTLKSKLEVKERGIVLRRRKKALRAAFNREKSEVKKAFLQKAIDINQLKIGAQDRETKANTKKRKELDPVAKEQEENMIPDNIIAQAAYDGVASDIIAAREIEERANENIIINNEDIIFSKSEEGQKKSHSVKIDRQVGQANTIEDLEILKKDLDESEIAKEDFEEIETKIGERMATIKAANKLTENKAAAKKVAAELKKKAKERDADITVENNQIHTPIGDVVEDENADAEPSFEKDQLDDEDKVMKSSIGSGRLMALLDKVRGIEAYQAWNENPVSKIGKVFGYTVSERSTALSTLQNDAIQTFENTLPSDPIPQSVYDNMPIKATLEKHSDIFTFLPTKPIKGSSAEKIHEYKQGYDSQRKIIIDRLHAGELVTSKVAKNSGGDLVTDYDKVSNTVPRHSILDILQIGNNMDNVELRFSDEKGYLMDSNKDPDTRFGKPILLAEDSNGNRYPYKGGVFLIIKKANGKPFALRLNLLSNTDAQSELLADLLSNMAVPEPILDAQGAFMYEGKKDKKTLVVSKKELNFKDTIDKLSPERLALVRELMGPEIEMLDPEYKEPKIMDLIKSFVYVSDKTKNKKSELYIKGNDIFFGGERMSPGFKNNPKSIAALVSFLRNSKRRQLNLKSWTNSDEYKNYVIENRIISTNAKPLVNSFANTAERVNGKMTGRRIQLYMEPVASRKEVGAIESDKGEVGISSEDDTEGATMMITMNEDGSFSTNAPEIEAEIEAEIIPEPKMSKMLTKVYGELKDSSTDELNKILEAHKKASYSNQNGKTTPISAAKATAARMILEERDNFDINKLEYAETQEEAEDLMAQGYIYSGKNDDGLPTYSKPAEQSDGVKSVKIKKDANSFYDLEIQPNGDTYLNGNKLDPKDSADSKIINKAMLKVTPFQKVSHGGSDYAVIEDGTVFNINKGNNGKVSPSAGKKLNKSGTRDAILKKAKQQTQQSGEVESKIDELKKEWKDKLDLIPVSEIEEIISKRNILSLDINRNYEDPKHQSIEGFIWNIAGHKYNGGNVMVTSFGKEVKGRMALKDIKQAIINLEDNDFRIDQIFEMIDNMISREEKDFDSEINNINNEYKNKIASSNQPQPTQQASEVKLEASDKIVWGHPGLGKTTFKENNPNNVLDFDTDFKPEVAKRLGLNKESQTSEGLNEWRTEENEEEFKAVMRKVWKEAVAESKKTGKMLVVSDMMFLKENEADFDKVVTTSEKTFIDRASRRGDNTEGLSSWKSNIDKTLSAVDSNKIVETDKYFSEIQQTQQSGQVVKTPLEGVSNDAIAEMSDENYKELVETGYTMWLDENGETSDAAYKPTQKTSEVEEITKEFTKGNVTARITNKPKYIYEKEAIENAKGDLIELELVKSGRMEQGFSQLIDTSTGETIATSWRGSGKIFQSGKSTEEILKFILGDITVADILGTSDLPSLLQQPTQQASGVEAFSKVVGKYTFQQKNIKGGTINQIIKNNENGSEVLKATKSDGSVRFFLIGKFEGVPGNMNGLATSQKEIDTVLDQLGVEAKSFLGIGGTTQQSSDTQISKPKNKSVPSKPIETILSSNQLVFKSSLTEDIDDEWGDVEMGDSDFEMNKDLTNMDSGQQENPCKNN